MTKIIQQSGKAAVLGLIQTNLNKSTEVQAGDGSLVLIPPLFKNYAHFEQQPNVNY